MKKLYVLLIVNLSVCVNIHSQLNFLEKKGQFFEQGYGRNLDEEAMDLLQDGNNTIMAGWQTYYKSGNKNFTLWRINQYGKQLSEFNFHDNWDNIATGIAKNTANTYILCGRSTPAYIPESVVEVGDSIKVLKVDTAGNIIWKFTYGRPDEGLAATDVFSNANNDIFVTGNRIELSNGRKSIFFLRLSPNGQLYWIEYYNHRTNSITTHEMSPYNTNQYILSINQESGGGNIPMLLVFNDSASVVQVEAYTQFIKSNWYGIAKDGSNNIWLAGYEYQSADTNGWIVKLNNNLSVNFSLSTGTQGTEKYKDISLTPVGYICLGTATNQGEGGNDVYMVHYDHQNKVTLKETLGTAEHERANSLMLRNLPEPVAQFAGYCKGYGVAESGNAYLGATLYYEIGTLLNGQNCEVPRVMWVDFFTWNNGNNGIDLQNRILNNTTRENNLISYAKINNIDHLLLYGLNFIFDPNYQSDPTTAIAKQKLSEFIGKCHLENITVGMISTTKEAVFTNAIDYNIDVANNASAYNYNHNGKISYFVLEHEFWNATEINAYSGNTAFPQYDNESEDPQDWVPANELNDHFISCYNDHKTLLTNLRSNANFDANVIGLLDYIGYFYFRWDNSSNNFDRNNITAQQSKATEIESLTDALFLVYYQEYSNDEYGKDFIITSQASGLRQVNVEDWKQRLSLLGKQSNKDTYIIPLFSSEYYVNQNDYCGRGVSTNFLGSYLHGYPGYGIGTLNSAESTFQNQYANEIDGNYNDFPDIDKIKVSAMSWYKYSCIDEKDFYNKSLLECEGFNNPFSIEDKKILQNGVLQVYPNPSENYFIINSEYAITYISVIDINGKLVFDNFIDRNVSNNEIEIKHQLSTGLYILNVYSEEGVLNFKILIK